MNLEKLKLAEAFFLQQYPGGFSHPEMIAIGKKHPIDRMVAQTSQQLAKDRFAHPAQLLESVSRIVARSSMVSMFEKPRFRDHVNSLSLDDRKALTSAYKTLLHSNRQEAGFNEVLDILADGKLAKWSLMTILLLYKDPQKEVFVKPTTTKKVIEHLELSHLEYRPRPSWAFYDAYRNTINEMKTRVDSSLSPNNAAFTGFLMMSF
jgi:hypothetical protein